MRIALIAAGLAAALAAAPVAGQDAETVHVVTTLPDLASIVRSVGGDRVTVTSLARGFEDPHYVTPTPALMSAVSRADLYLEIGLSLELWSEKVLDGARNPKVRVGTPGHDYVSRGVRLLEVPRLVTRAQGDLHPEGNPHIWLDPLNGIVMARNIRDALTRVAPRYASDFKAGCEAFDSKVHTALYGEELVKMFGGPLLEQLDRGKKLIPFLEKKAFEGRPLIDRLGGMHGLARSFSGRPIVFYHRSWTYFADRFGLSIRAYVEDKPGIPPSARHRDEIVALMKAEEIPVLAMSNYYPRKVPEAIVTATGAKLVVLPNSTGGEKGADEYIAFLTLIASRLAEAYGG